MKFLLLFTLFLTTTLFAQTASKAIPELTITPINHTSLLLNWKGKRILIDPVGNFPLYEKMGAVDLILITDIHGDHLDISRIKSHDSKKTTLVAPEEVYIKLTEVEGKKISLANDQSTVVDDLKITAMPMYNISPERQKFHQKGRGNGYLLETDGKRLYLSGDTEDIPEMRNLKDIDVAFLCMNLPYTMTEDQAINATLAFAPKEVYPFHYRGKKGDQAIFSDVERFKREVMKRNPKIKVILLQWY